MKAAFARILDEPEAQRGHTTRRVTMAIARAFWWGFHIEVSHTELNDFVNAADPVNAVIGAVGLGVPTPASPFIGLAAAFIAAGLGLLRTIDRGRGAYVSMSWFAPGIFIPTTV
jgi:hypothetical protein